MAFHSWTPSPPLCHFVSTLWVLEGVVPSASRERIMPTGTLGLILDLDDVPGPRASGFSPGSSGASTSVLCGAHPASFVLEWPSRPVSLVGAEFRPGGAFPFLPFPVGEVQGTHVAVEAVWGAATRDLRDRLRATGAPARVSILEQWLLERAVRPLQPAPVVTFALAELGRGGARVADVTARIGLSTRRFIEVFRDSVGLTPKLFCRVQRFQEALAILARRGPVDLADLALAAGYYDQAHFNHDFRAFAGLTPSAYAARRGEYQNHVPIEGSEPEGGRG